MSHSKISPAMVKGLCQVARSGHLAVHGNTVRALTERELITRERYADSNGQPAWRAALTTKGRAALAPTVAEDHAEAFVINAKLEQVARLEAHGSRAARETAYDIRDEILAAGFKTEAVANVKTTKGLTVGGENFPPVCEHQNAHQNAHLVCPAKDDTVRVPGTVAVHSVGELHMTSFPPHIPERVTFAYNLSDLLDDPAHKPDARLVKLDGTDARVGDFVFATDGAMSLFWSIAAQVRTQVERGKNVVVMLICRGGRHRSVAFAEELAEQFDVTARHHHKHLDVVEKTDDGTDRLGIDLLALSEQIVRMGIESEEQLIDALRRVTEQ